MMMLDTNICVFAIRNKRTDVSEKMRQYEPGDLVISAITLAELEHGVAVSSQREKNAAMLLGFLLSVRVEPFGTRAAAEYGPVQAMLKQKGTPIGPLDTLIAAHARSAGCTLVTHNTREFERVDGLVLDDWLV